MKRQILIYDIETFENLFLIGFYIRKTQEYKFFIIHESRNDVEELLEFLYSQSWIMVGFNNEGFDYPIVHHLINHKKEYLQLNGLQLSKRLYTKSQEIIKEEFATVWDKNKHFPQLDLYLIHHFNNKARKASLKDIEVALKMPLVEDMPLPHDSWIKEDQIQLIQDYNKNDLYATWQFFELTIGNTKHSLYENKNKLELRLKLRDRYDIPCLNWNDVKIGEQLILKLYCDSFGYNPKDIKNLKTYYDKIELKNCIPSWAKFNNSHLNKLLEFFNKGVIYKNETYEKNNVSVLSYNLIYHNSKFNYGIGGLHQAIKSGVYKSDDEWGIYDWDVSSMYPSLIMSLNLFPQHLGDKFLAIYGDKIVKIRLSEKSKPKKERDNVIIEGFKLSANGTYGKLNAEESFLYDPMVAFSTTVAGQIFLTMWIERFIEVSPDIKILTSNTDGICVLARRSDFNKLVEASDKLMSETNLSYEQVEYKKIVVQDVNNYISEYADGYLKYKGLFEIDKELHKDPSMRIVPIALRDYFIKNISVEETIRNHKDIYDFCLRLKTDSRFIPTYNYLDKDDNFKYKTRKLSRTTRYYISNKGGSLLKLKNHSGTGNKATAVNKGFVVQIFNNFEERKDYDINYQFYISECYKIINSIEDKQLNLFNEDSF